MRASDAEAARELIATLAAEPPAEGEQPPELGLDEAEPAGDAAGPADERRDETAS